MNVDLEWSDEQLAEAGLDRKKVESIARRLTTLGKEMQALGLSVYGASGHGHLTHKSIPVGENGFDAVIADLGEGFCGGDW